MKAKKKTKKLRLEKFRAVDCLHDFLFDVNDYFSDYDYLGSRTEDSDNELELSYWWFGDCY